MPLADIQLGRADDDDEEWLDVLDAESDEWMRKPQVREAAWWGYASCAGQPRVGLVHCQGRQAAGLQ